jgi:hypothetical protein
LGSWMESLKESRISASVEDAAVLHMKNARLRQRAKVYVQVVAIGGESEREPGCVFSMFFYLSVKRGLWVSLA